MLTIAMNNLHTKYNTIRGNLQGAYYHATVSALVKLCDIAWHLSVYKSLLDQYAVVVRSETDPTVPVFTNGLLFIGADGCFKAKIPTFSH